MFHEFYNDTLQNFKPRPEVTVVAHSFGTYILAHALRTKVSGNAF